MVSVTSSRTGGPNRRRASSRSSACSRSSSRSSSTSRSALRVTRNSWCSTTSMPGNSSARWAAIRSSSGRKSSTPRRTRTNRATLLGTLTRANRSAAGLRVADDDRQVQAEPGDVGERVRRVDRQRGQHREDLRGEVLGQPLPVLGVDRVPAQDPDAGLGQRRRDVVGEAAALPVDQLLGARGDQRQLLARGQPVGAGAPTGPCRGGASARRPGPCRTRRGCGRRSPGTSPAPAAAGAGSSASASTRALKSSQDSSRLKNRSSGSGSSSGCGLRDRLGRTAVERFDRRCPRCSSRPANWPMPSAGGGPPSEPASPGRSAWSAVSAVLLSVAREPLLAVTSTLSSVRRLGCHSRAVNSRVSAGPRRSAVTRVCVGAGRRVERHGRRCGRCGPRTTGRPGAGEGATVARSPVYEKGNAWLTFCQVVMYPLSLAARPAQDRRAARTLAAPGRLPAGRQSHLAPRPAVRRGGRPQGRPDPARSWPRRRCGRCRCWARRWPAPTRSRSSAAAPAPVRPAWNCATEALADGRVVLIYPEGTVTRDPDHLADEAPARVSARWPWPATSR